MKKIYHTILLASLGLGVLISANYCAAKMTERFGWRLDMTSNSYMNYPKKRKKYCSR